MGSGNFRRSLAMVVPALVWALILTACGSVQQPETTAPSPSSARPGTATPAGSSVLEGVFTARRRLGARPGFGKYARHATESASSQVADSDSCGWPHGRGPL